MHIRSASRHTHRWVSLLIVLLAFALRVAQPDLVEFKGDEATVVRRVFFILHWGQRPVTGVYASVGIPHPAHFLYLMTAPLALWPDPLAAVLFLVFLNTLAVALTYRLAARYLSPGTGTLAAFLFAVSPWAVIYARKIWTQNIPLVTLLFFLALLATFVRGRPWMLSVAMAALALLVGLHIEGVAFVPVLVILMLVYPRRVKVVPLAVGLALALALLGPYVLHDARQGWVFARRMLTYGGQPAQVSADALRYAFALNSGAGIPALAGESHRAYLASLPPWWGMNRGMDVLLALALAYGISQIVKGTPARRRIFLILLLWFALPVVLQIRHTSPVYPHYFIPLFPVQMILVAAFLVDACRWLRVAVVQRWGMRGETRLRRWGTRLGLAMLLLWGGWQIAVWARLLTVVDTLPTDGGFGVPLKYHRQAVGEAVRLAEGDGIIVLTQGTGLGTDMMPTLLNALLFTHDHRFADVDEAVPIPPGRAVYLLGPLPPDAPSVTLAREVLTALGAQEVAHIALPNRAAYLLFLKPPTPRPDFLPGITHLVPPIRLENGVSVLGYAWPTCIRPHADLSLRLVWQVESVPPATYQFFVHLLGENGEQLRALTAGGFPPMFWRPGDLVVSTVRVQAPSSEALPGLHVRVGMYRHPDGERSRVVAPEEQAGNDAILLPVPLPCRE